MTRQLLVRRGAYQDSARLMRVARELGTLAGVASADVMMGTPANVALLVRAGFPAAALQSATPMDMVVALVLDAADGLVATEERLADLLAGTGSRTRAGDDEIPPASVAEAVRLHPAANLVSIAVPGPYAAFVANRALDAGKHVFLFSDNVAIEHEVALKRRAAALGLLLMGPDCGTAIVAGVGLGFANRVPRGPVGIVGASGTGIQEVSCALSRLGVGVSHAIGTGSRDLSAAVNGIMTEFSLRLLADDEATSVIALVAKHPAPEVADRLHGVLAGLGKTVVVRYLGEGARRDADGVVYAETLDDVAAIAAEKSGAASVEPAIDGCRPLGATARVSGRLVGLFGGGSLAAEARHVLARHGVTTAVPVEPLVPGQPLPVGLGVPADSNEGLPDRGTVRARVEATATPGNLIADLGDDAYTVGRPHPMVDQTPRCDLIRSVGADPTVGLVLLDLVLGDGAHSDPAPEIAAAVADARARRSASPLAVVCSVCGSAADPQHMTRQTTVLEAAGIHTEPTAARAARAAAAAMAAIGEGSAR